ncbi:autotransporter [Opitutaceae bacterium TAV5]|nr:autotransporter [Opitutaceae bacterium TAV5]
MKTKNNLHIYPYIVGVFAILAGALLPIAVRAQTWIGGGGADNNWSTAANWDSAPVFADNPTLTLTGTTNYTSNANAAVTLTRLNFNPAGGNATLTGEELTFKAGSGGTTPLIFIGPGTAGGNVTIKNNIKLLGTGAIQASTRNLILDGDITLTTGQVQFNANASKTITINGEISGTTSTLAFTGHTNGTGRIYLNTNNTYTGSTAIWTGGVVLAVDALNTGGAFGANTSAVALGASSGATFTPSLLTGAQVTVGRDIRVVTNTTGTTTSTIGGESAHVSTFSGNITLGSDNAAAAALRLTAAANGRVNITGNLLRATGAASNADAITKVGAGIVAIEGDGNTYMGATTLTEGTLLVNGNLSTITGDAAAVTASVGTTLGGIGTIGRNVKILDGASLEIGDNHIAETPVTGSLTIIGNLDLADTTTVKFDLGATRTASDRLIVEGGVTFGGTVTFDLSALSGLGGSGYTLLSATGGFIGNTGSIVFTGYDFTNDYQLVIGTNSISLVSTAIPEPRTTALLIGGVFFGIIVALRLRRNRQA